MCGIAGLVHFDGRPVDPGLLRRMCDALRHRGPDDEGLMTWPRAAEPAHGRPAAGLANRRLSIIDVAGGHQPIGNESRDVWTVLNGEIYNFAELRGTLERLGHRFETRSDTEVVVHAYEEWGESFVSRLDGMFALAIWDVRHDCLLLARDPFGKKPLCYASAGPDFAFASELQSLMAAPHVGRTLDRDALGDYLAYMAIPAPRTIYREVRKVPPGHVLIAGRDGVQVRRYWEPRYEPKLRISEPEAAERVRELLAAAVRKRLISEVPLGAFLSGGVDSSVVVALMASLSNGPVKTFSIGFDDPRYDELPEARRVARAFGTEHHEFVVQPRAVEVLPALVRHFGEPYADSSAIPTSYLAALTRQHVTVALTGDGGDEVFAGYGRHLGNRLAEQWRALAVVGRSRTGNSAARQSWSRLRRFAVSAAMTRAERYRAWAGVFSPDALAALSDDVPDGQRDVAALFERWRGLDSVDAILAVDTLFYLPTDLLPKMDITTMMHSLEARSPFLDRDLVEFAMRLPSRLKLRRLTTKSLVKRAFEGVVPAENLSGKKRGFAVPIAAWLRGELRGFLDDHLRPARVASAGLVRQPAIDVLIDEHVSGAADRAHELWSLLMLELWYRECGTAASPAS